VAGLALTDKAERIRPLALVTSRTFLAIVTLIAVNVVGWFAHYVRADLIRPRLPSWAAGDWTGPWKSPEYGSGRAEMVLRVDPDRVHRLTGTLAVTYLNGRCVFTLAGDSATDGRADVKMTGVSADSDRCDAGLGHHLVIQRPDSRRDLLSVAEVPANDPGGTVFEGDLTRAS
jgi:hypothetical protein